MSKLINEHIETVRKRYEDVVCYVWDLELRKTLIKVKKY